MTSRPSAVARIGAQLSRGIGGEGPRVIVATLALLGAWYATSLVYATLNHGPTRIFLRTPVDAALPVVPVFVIPYISLTPFIAVSMVVFLAIRVRIFRSAAVAMILAGAISYTFYILLQSYVDRPVLTGNDVFSGMVRSVYSGDNPYNDFPSLHASLSTILAIHWVRVGRRAGSVVTIWVVLIVASTVLIRQHYLADVAAGLSIAFVTSRLAWHWLGQPSRQPEPGASPNQAERTNPND